ncbi:MAG: GDP-fucose synthetase [Omnitrophica WOR_2 bacterium RIFCSPHIGHO2_01_FULL_49_10]|nr:MAG: GDP-fucose synthetase [Omnitrophica WOR_2 bacterium RIFCSPHIGHO2_01_FULL_49_10]
MKRDSKILIIGRGSLTGMALSRRLKADGFKKVFTMPARDLADQAAVGLFFKKNRPDYVFFMDVKSGGIIANSTYPAEFIYDNLQAEINVIHAAYKTKVKKLLFMASSCAYPKKCPQPMKEEYLLNGPLEPTSEAFAIAKIAGMKMCQYYNRQYGTDFVCAIPATAYGPGDNFDPKTSHVIPGLIRKLHAAKISRQSDVAIWGSGKPRREFIHVDDLADAVVFIMQKPKTPPVINIGTGSDISVKELAELLKDIIDFEGRLKFDRTKPDGAARKLLDAAKLKSISWTAKASLKTGLRDLYRWYLRYAA